MLLTFFEFREHFLNVKLFFEWYTHFLKIERTHSLGQCLRDWIWRDRIQGAIRGIGEERRDLFAGLWVRITGVAETASSVAGIAAWAVSCTMGA